MNVLGAHDLLQFGAGHVSVRAKGHEEFAIVGHLHLLDDPPEKYTSDHIVRVDFGGTVLAGSFDPPDEFHIHAEIYRARPDVHAIAHTHPKGVIATTAAELEIVGLDVRSAVFGDGVPLLRYPDSIHVTTQERGEKLAASLGTGPAVAMQGHGAVTVAATPEQAVVLSLCLERAALIRLQLASMPFTLFPATDITPGGVSGLASDEMFRTAWKYFEKRLIR
jgi:ribulose-5-phosphate 4-epimerase/fuculose-1-phosphate aldolase